MNCKKSIWISIVALSLALSSCYDNKMTWDDPYDHPSADDLPLELQEKIAMYEAVNAYAEFKIGVSIDFRLYTTDENYAAIVNENFDDAVAGNEMKMQSLMNSAGVINYGNTDATIDALRAAGLSVYGHVLVWHQQAQAAYLNSLIKPTTLPGAPGESLIDGTFENGMGDWVGKYDASNYTIVDSDKVDGTQSLQIVVPATAASKYDAELDSPVFSVKAGHHYQISFWIKSNGAGQIDLDFGNSTDADNLGNQYPYISIDGGASADVVNVGTTWSNVVINTTVAGDPAMIAIADSDAMQFRILLGAVPDVTYWIDAIEVTDLDDVPTDPVNLLPNGGFETGDGTGWTGEYNPANYTVVDTEKAEGTYSMQAFADVAGGNNFEAVLVSPAFSIVEGHDYLVSFKIKSDIAGEVGLTFSNGNLGNQYPWGSADGGASAGTFVTGPDAWTEVVFDPTVTTDSSGTNPAMTATASDDTITFSIFLGKVGGVTYYIDDAKVLDITAPQPAPAPVASAVKTGIGTRAAPIVIEKTPEEKKEIITDVFVDYITQVATHYKGKVAAWDVLNEPMNGNGTVNTGVEDFSATSVFHWAYYLGEEYGALAFKTARAADPDALLFINEFGLENDSSSAKLDGYIEYIQRIDDALEADGIEAIDGIGTQMHLNINWNWVANQSAKYDAAGNETETFAKRKKAIADMFTKLAATGKLVKVTELDIAIDPTSNAGTGPAAPLAPSLEQQQMQAELFEYVARMFSEKVPVAQQYGITIWGVSDAPEQHAFWLPNDAPFLFDATYERKWAYKSFCDGLAGEDVSAGWTLGDL